MGRFPIARAHRHAGFSPQFQGVQLELRYAQLVGKTPNGGLDDHGLDVLVTGPVASEDFR